MVLFPKPTAEQLPLPWLLQIAFGPSMLLLQRVGWLNGSVCIHETSEEMEVNGSFQSCGRIFVFKAASTLFPYLFLQIIPLLDQ